MKEPTRCDECKALLGELFEFKKQTLCAVCYEEATENPWDVSDEEFFQ